MYAQAVERSSEVVLAGFLEELDALGLRDDTMLVFVSDHGESWGERFVDKTAVKGTFHMHGATLYDEIAEVPLIVSAPGRVDPGIVGAQVSLVDLTPTLLDYAGAPLEGADGTTLRPFLETGDGDRGPVWIVGTDAGRVSQLALRAPPWKLIAHLESGEEEAYRLDLDPRERHSRPDEIPPELRERLYAEIEQVAHVDVSDEEAAVVESRLADLGYL
jgi:choline-sulfatase